MIELRDITKRFGAVVANDHVSITVDPGTIHAIVGENGAGKSTAMRIAYGFYTADSGDIVKEVVEGRFTGGFHVYGLESDGVGYVVDDFNRALVSPDAIAAAEEAKKKIIGGEIKVTDAMAQ